MKLSAIPSDADKEIVFTVEDRESEARIVLSPLSYLELVAFLENGSKAKQYQMLSKKVKSIEGITKEDGTAITRGDDPVFIASGLLAQMIYPYIEKCCERLPKAPGKTLRLAD